MNIYIYVFAPNQHVGLVTLEARFFQDFMEHLVFCTVIFKAQKSVLKPSKNQETHNSQNYHNSFHKNNIFQEPWFSRGFTPTFGTIKGVFNRAEPYLLSHPACSSSTIYVQLSSTLKT